MVLAMKTREPDTPKSTTTKKPPPAKTPTEPATENQAPAAPKPTVTKPAPATKAKQVKTKVTTAPSPGSPQPAVEEAKASPDVVKVTPEKKAVPRTRIVKKIVKKIVVKKKVPTSAKAVANKSPPMLVTKLANVEESSKKEEIEDAKDVEFVNKEESTLVSTKESVKKEETDVQNAEGSTMEDNNVENVEEPTTKEEVTGDAQPLVENVEFVSTKESVKKEETDVQNAEGSTMEENNVENVEEPTTKEEVTGDAQPLVENVEEPTKKNEVCVDAQPSVENVEEQTKKKEVAGDVKRLDENVEELTKKNEVAINAQPSVENVEEPAKKKKVAGDVQPLVENVEELTKKEEVAGDAQTLAETVRLCSKKEDPALTDSVKSSANQETSIEKAEEEETNMIEDKVELNQPVNMDKDTNEESKGDDVPPWEQVDINDEKMERRDDKESHEEFGEEDLVEDNVVEHGEESAELKEENAELTALAKERKIKKELEIFVGGLDRDAVEDDVKKVFDNVGEVVEVRLQKNPSSNKNKGYAFVRFATKEQATRALVEIKNPVIHGKRCRTSPSEDNNDTLFLGNICNTWTKEAIKQKLKDYGIDGVENINLVEDPQQEGLSRGFAFVEFSCHAEAMLAYKRLQKPDVIFGHSDRTAKVAFAEPLPQPDPAVMALVKSVFVDGLPPHWDEDRVRKEFKCYGDLDRITLARNMSNAKRKDFGFVDFTTHQAAVACIDDINTRGLGDGKFKTRVRARLSNPLPKTQIVKGGMCGGFRIGHPSGGTFSKFGKGFRRGGHPDFSVQDFQHDWGFYQHGSAQTDRMGFIDERDFDSPYPPTHGMESFQGRRWGTTVPARHALDRFKHGDTDRGPGRHMPWRGQPVFPGEEFNRTFLGRQFDDPYRYDGSAHGIKRRNFIGKHSDYVEPSRVRARYDYSDPAFLLRGTRYRDTFGDGSSLYSHSHDYYGPDYPRGSDSSFYGGDHPYGGRYYQ